MTKQLAKPIKAKPNKAGQFRVYGMFGTYTDKSNPFTRPRVWKAIAADGSRIIFPDTILKIEDAEGYVDEVLAGEHGLEFSEPIRKKL